MNSYKPSTCKRHIFLILLATFALPTISNAETYNFRVIFAEVPASEAIRAGDADAAIEILENRVMDAATQYVADERATLCALYIVKRMLAPARKMCQFAVETEQSEVAYNNRGVLRAHLGDATGALEDFERAKGLPGEQQSYIEDLESADTHLIASSNYSVGIRFSVRRAQIGQSLAGIVHGARVEELGN
jgi:hypothetical protein